MAWFEELFQPTFTLLDDCDEKDDVVVDDQAALEPGAAAAVAQIDDTQFSQQRMARLRKILSLNIRMII